MRSILTRAMLCLGLATTLAGCAEELLRAMPAQCGDGVTQTTSGEQCDDGNTNNTDGCTTLCQLPVCGDGYLQADSGEACDDGDRNGASDSMCDTSCRSTCGNGVVDANEECDHGGSPNADCNVQCKTNPCGNNVVDDGEECDDGNLNDDDACNNSCRAPVCGDGKVQGNEQCEPANDPDCRSDCTTKVCSSNETSVGGVINKGELSSVYTPGAVFADFKAIDALELDVSDSRRISSVEIAIALPVNALKRYNGNKIAVVILDGAAASAQPYVVEQTFNYDQLKDWQTIKGIENLIDIMNDPIDVQVAWMRFDFSSVLPAGGLTSTAAIVGILWPDREGPPVGGAKKDQCTGGWYSKGCSSPDADLLCGVDGLKKSAAKAGCTWPMLRINTSVTSTEVVCE